MNNLTDKGNFEKLVFNSLLQRIFSVDEDIDPDTNLFKDKKTSKIRLCFL